MDVAETSAGWVGREARRARLVQVSRRRGDAEAQVASFRGFLDRLAEQLREALAADRKDYARELLSRRLSLRARLSEVEARHRALLEEERRLALEADAPEPAPAPTPYPAPAPYPPYPAPPPGLPPTSVLPLP